jgi:D-alanine-D-alanine ligase-like ATP-grasp enzyme
MVESTKPKQLLYILISVAVEEVHDQSKIDHEIEILKEQCVYGKELIKLFNDAGYDTKLLCIPLHKYQQYLTNNLPPPEDHPLILNICESFGIDGKIEARSVGGFLDQLLYKYAGADCAFDTKCNSKMLAKKLFTDAKVPTLPYVYFTTFQPSIKARIEDGKLKYPLILKPTHSLNSVGMKGPLNNYQDVEDAVKEGVKSFFGMYLEEYLQGKEYACFVYDDKEGTVALDPICFERSLVSKEHELKEISVEDKDVREKVKEISLRAYKAVSGRSFARVDIRERESTHELFVLEVHDSPSLVCNSLKSILQMNKINMCDLLRRIIGKQAI